VIQFACRYITDATNSSDYLSVLAMPNLYELRTMKLLHP